APSKGVSGAPGFDPTLFLYDRMPGGVGLAPRLFEQRHELLARTIRLLEGCTCESGCPSCVGPTIGFSANGKPSVALGDRRQIGLRVLKALGIARSELPN
ncbi:MAG: hypothetical protein RL701_7628, partial [Pseudomonadota bacterium]